MATSWLGSFRESIIKVTIPIGDHQTRTRQLQFGNVPSLFQTSKITCGYFRLLRLWVKCCEEPLKGKSHVERAEAEKGGGGKRPATTTGSLLGSGRCGVATRMPPTFSIRN